MKNILLLLLALSPIASLNSQELKTLSSKVVFEQDPKYVVKSYKHFLSLLGSHRLETNDINKFNGVAISPEKAANCMLEPERTIAFVRSLYLAAEQMEKEDIKILYVGSGPLAPFMTLTAPLLPNARYTLVEISKNAADAAKLLIERLDLQAQLDTMIIADATLMKLPNGRQFDIIITETMDAGLNNEMMIPILINILPQLKKEVILIPEEVTLELVISKKAIGEEPLEQHTIFTATDLLQTYWETGIFPDKQINPDLWTGAKSHVSTTILVFKDICLYQGESSITRNLPVKYSPGKPMYFSYSITPPRLILN